MQPPPELAQSLESQLSAKVISCDYLTSGAANNVFRVQTESKGSFIVKVCKSDLPDLFRLEAEALRHIASTKTVFVPEVLQATQTYLLMQDLGPALPEASDQNWRGFGRQFGQMHSVVSESFGYQHDNYIGIWNQKNTQTQNWLEFFWDNRVACYLDSGMNREILTSADRDGIRRIVDKIGDSVPDQAPSLCHGDFWNDNVIRAGSGKIYVIDPALHYGLPEADLVMTQMYGGFPDSFYDGYRETHELPPDWKDRQPLYQLKELLLMIAQFGDQKSLDTLRESIKQFN